MAFVADFFFTQDIQRYRVLVATELCIQGQGES